ncbi:MAG: glycosyltransferase family protein [Frankiaceae bacterium]
MWDTGPVPNAAHSTQRLPVLGVVQARMSSSRLPGKVLQPLGTRSVLAWVLRAAQAADELDEVVVATSVDSSDDALVEAIEQFGARVYRGPLTDVLGRFVGAVDEADRRSPGVPVAAVVRLTADCPLLDPDVIDLVVRTWRASPELDHLTTTNPRCLPRGLDVEIVSRWALADVDSYAEGPDRVHVTSAVYRQPERYAVAGICLHPDASDLRVTLDTEEDARMLAALVPLLSSERPGWRQVVRVLREHPEIAELNAQVRQKELSEG